MQIKAIFYFFVGGIFIFSSCDSNINTYPSKDNNGTTTSQTDSNETNGSKTDIDQVVQRYKVKSSAQASAFLSKATFGATLKEINNLVSLNNYEQWIDEQLKAKPTFHMKWAEDHIRDKNGILALKKNPELWKTNSNTFGYAQRDIWWHIATYAKDQLRQRVALALSEILVISRKNASLAPQPDARISYYDTLIKDAFGTFEKLLLDVTYHPSMGKYLSYLGNPKSKNGSHPDENYAREVMQLFTIGLYELKDNGTQKLDKNKKPIPTYTQKDIKEMARIFTGLTDQNGYFYASDGGSNHKSRTKPMIAAEEYHDTGTKKVLNHTINTGSTKGDIDAAIHMLAFHHNTAPFISKQLIQRLVTSNPSPEYVSRIVSVFKNNGKGVRGDLGAVVKAILLDKEALDGAKLMPNTFGKFREPMLYYTNLFRTFSAEDNVSSTIQVDDGPIYQYESFNFNGNDMTQQEGPLESLTVFNYFTPTDGPASLKKKYDLVAPELNLYGKRGIDDVLMGIINKNSFVYDTYHLYIKLKIDKEIEYVAKNNFTGLINHLDLLLTGDNMSKESKKSIIEYLTWAKKNGKDEDGKPISNKKLARYAIALVMSSPDYALQR